jgi:hypothetical protein
MFRSFPLRGVLCPPPQATCAGNFHQESVQWTELLSRHLPGTCLFGCAGARSVFHVLQMPRARQRPHATKSAISDGTATPKGAPLYQFQICFQLLARANSVQGPIHARKRKEASHERGIVKHALRLSAGCSGPLQRLLAGPAPARAGQAPAGSAGPQRPSPRFTAAQLDLCAGVIALAACERVRDKRPIGGSRRGKL